MIKNYEQFNEGLFSSFKNKELITKIESSTKDNLYSIIEQIYPKTSGGLEGYPFLFINDNFEYSNFDDFKKQLIGALKGSSLSDISLFGPTENKKGKRWSVIVNFGGFAH